MKKNIKKIWIREAQGGMDKMRREGLSPDVMSFSAVISAYEKGWQHAAPLLHNLLSGVSWARRIVSACFPIDINEHYVGRHLYAL